MLLFNKDKSKKKDSQPINIDNKHQEIIKSFDNQKKNISELQSKYQKIKNEYEKLCAISNNVINDNELDRKFVLKCELDELEKKLNNTSNSTQYFVNTGHILFNYYNKSNNINEFTDIDKKNPLSKSILDFFKQGTHDESEQPITNLPPTIPNDQKKDFKKGISKTKMFDKYMSYVDSKFISDKDKEDDIEVCKQCYQQKLFVYAEGLLICQKCGVQEYVFIDCDKPSYREPPKEIAYFAYKRINHFNEHISQFQGKESTEIPDEIYEHIKKEIKKERITDLTIIKPEKIREILKKLDLNKYYEHIPHIINHINGIPPPNITKSQEETLRVMFKEIQIPFMKYCPPERQNFLSYTYVLHKFCELLELDNLLPCFPLLKSREKLQEQDAIWEKICNDLNWCFYKSI
jgi:hypothetical protein